MPTDTAKTCACGLPLQTGYLNGKHVRLCLACGEQSAVPTELKLPGLDPGRHAVQAKGREVDLVNRIRRALLSRGYLVTRVGQFRSDLAGSDKAAPDILIGLEGLTVRETCEVKLPGWTQSDCQPEQWELYQRGSLNIVASVEEALTVAERLHAIREGREKTA